MSITPEMRRQRAYRARRTAKLRRYEEALRKIAGTDGLRVEKAVGIARTALGETK